MTLKHSWALPPYRAERIAESRALDGARALIGQDGLPEAALRDAALAELLAELLTRLAGVGIHVTGDSAIVGALAVSAGLTVQGGGAALTGAVGITGTLSTSGALTVQGGGAAITGAVGITGNASVAGALSATGAAGVVDAAAGYKIAGAAPLGQYVRGDGTKGVFAAIPRADLPALLRADLPARNRCRLHRNGVDLAAAAGAFVTVPWTTESFDVGALHDPAVNSSRVTVPAGAGGYYRADVQVTFAPSNVGYRILHITKNGVGVARYTTPTPNSVDRYSLATTALLNLVPGDYLEVAVEQGSAGSLNVLGADIDTFFQVAEAY